MGTKARTRQKAALCLGIDLAGVAHRETGIALLRNGCLDLLTTADTDEAILAHVARVGKHATIAINAPLTLPRGRCCLDDNCPCRHNPGTRSRQLERDLLHLRVHTLATALLKVLARRGMHLAATLRTMGWEPIEVYPYATLTLLGLPSHGKRTQLGRRRIHQALQALVPGLDHPDSSEHELDAVVCAYTAQLWRTSLARTIGAEDEGVMIIPISDARATVQSGGERRMADERAPYVVGDNS